MSTTVPRALYRMMASRNITKPDDRGKLSEQQLNKLLENQPIQKRIEIKSAVANAGIYPRTLPAFKAW